MSCRGSRRLLLMRDGISGRWASSGLSGPVANPWAWRVPSLFRVRGNLRITKTRLTQLSVRLGQADRVGERTSPLERAASARTGAMTGARAEGREWRDRRGGESKTVNINRCSHNRRATESHMSQLSTHTHETILSRSEVFDETPLYNQDCSVYGRLSSSSRLCSRSSSRPMCHVVSRLGHPILRPPAPCSFRACPRHFVCPSSLLSGRNLLATYPLLRA
jgi:hypothetical protein